MVMKTCSYSSIIRSSGIYDIVVMLPFTVPGVVEWTLLQLQAVHNSLALGGSFPEFSPFHLLFINVMALITIVWSILRVHNPIPRYAAYDTVARILIATIMLVYLVRYNITEILWLFLLAEVAWVALQVNGYFYKYKKQIEFMAKPA